MFGSILQEAQLLTYMAEVRRAQDDAKQDGKPEGKPEDQKKKKKSPKVVDDAQKRKSNMNKMLAKIARLDAKAARITKQAESFRTAYQKMKAADAAIIAGEESANGAGAEQQQVAEEPPSPSQAFFIDSGKKEAGAANDDFIALDDTPMTEDPAAAKVKKEKKKKSKKSAESEEAEEAEEVAAEDVNEPAVADDLMAMDDTPMANQDGDVKVKKDEKKKSKKNKSQDVEEAAPVEEVVALLEDKKASKKRKRELKSSVTEEADEAENDANDEQGDQPAAEKNTKKSKKAKKAKVAAEDSTTATDGAGTEDAAAKGGAEQWNVSALEGGDARQQKFLRLLGAKQGRGVIGGGVGGTSSTATATGSKQTIASMQSNLERQYESGMRRKDEPGGRKRGLGA
jgi:hypothetical protein